VDYKDPHVWVNHIAPHYDFVFNHALQGSGLERLIRRLLEFLEHVPQDELDDWIFLLQISQPNRQEFVTGEAMDLWHQVAFSRGNAGVKPKCIIAYDSKTDDPDLINAILDAEVNTDTALLRALEEVYSSHGPVHCHKQELYTQFANLQVLVNILQKRKLKYLITAMDPWCHNPEYVVSQIPSPDLLRMTRELDTDYFIKSSSELFPWSPTTQLYDPCGHLNVEGNKLFANYIHTELKRYGYINE